MDKIVPKYSSVPGRVPEPENLIEGEIATNTGDSIMFLKNANNDIVKVGGIFESGDFDTDVKGTSTPGAVIYTKRICRYIQIGALIHLVLNFGWNSHSGVGDIIIDTLPKPPIDGISYALNISCNNQNVTKYGASLTVDGIKIKLDPAEFPTGVTELTITGFYEI